MFIINLLLFLLALSLLIFIHEMGHFIFAKIFNVYCMEFSLGMGPLIVSKKFKKDPETKYSLRYLPIGGYVAMAGEIHDDENEKELNIPYTRTINGIKPFKRSIVVVAGVLFNFIFALILIAIYIFATGVITNDGKANIEKNSIAYNSGLRTNDEISKVTSNIIKENGSVVYSACIEEECNVDTISSLIGIVNEKSLVSNQTQELTVSYIRDGELKSTTLIRSYDNEKNEPQLFGLSVMTRTPGFFEGIGLTFETFGKIIVLMFEAIGSLFTKDGIKQVGGPIQVYSISAQMASEGLLSYIWFLAIISVNLGFFNLLPIPGLDGARFFLSLGETITNKKFNPKIESYINAAGIILLFGLMIVVTIKDIIMLF